MRCTRGKIKGDGYNEEAKRRKEKKERVGREREEEVWKKGAEEKG